MERGYVQFHPLLAQWVGGYKPALLLGHALYWTHHWLAQQPHRDGWFWKTAREWQDATALSPREQNSSREALRDSGLWQERLQGNPARMFYRVNLDALQARAGLQKDPKEVSPGALTDLLGMPVLYFKPLADVAGGSAAGLVLSQLLGAMHTAIGQGTMSPDGYFVHSVEDSRIGLCLGSKVQRNARDALRRAGLLQDAWTQEQRPRLMVRLNLRAILACLSGQAPTSAVGQRKAKRPTAAAVELVPVQQSLLDNRAQVIGRDGNVTQVMRLLQAPNRRKVASPAGQSSDHGGNRHPRVALLSMDQVLGDAKGCPFVETGVALLSKLYTNEFNTKTTTARERAREGAVENRGPRRSRVEEISPSQASEARSGDLFEVDPKAGTVDVPWATGPNAQQGVDGEPSSALIPPARLDPALRLGALRIATKAPPELRQAVLDELDGHLGLPRKVIANPLGWLHAIVEQALAGTLTLTMADSVAAARVRRQRHEAQLATALSGGPWPDVVGAVTRESAQVRKDEALAKLRTLRSEMAAKAAANGALGTGPEIKVAAMDGDREKQSQ
jgi:hypothetical protein